MTRGAWISLVFALVMGVGAVMVQRSFRSAEDRPAVQRRLSEMRLRQFAEAIATYRTRHGDWPRNLFQLQCDAHLPLGFNAVRGGGIYGYRPPPPGTDDQVVVMASDGIHAGVRAGQPWGGEGQVAATDIPPVAYVLTAGGAVQAVPPEERDRRWKSTTATIPASAP